MLRDKHIKDSVVLQDTINGRTQPWKQKKVRSLKVADSFRRLSDDKRADRMRSCGSTLGFLRNLETGEKRLATADFCRERLCPMCQWRKSLKVFRQVSKVLDRAQEDYKDLVPLFLTLTLKNCSGDVLSATLDTIFKGWNLLWKQRKLERIVQGWFRALEVTYNKRADTYHPHIHAIILVDRGYFKGKDYMGTAEWVQLWRTALGVDYDPICDIRKVKNDKAKYKSVAEVAKYTLKDTDLVHNDAALMDKVVHVLGTALKGRRLFAFGGLLKRIAKQLDIEELAEGDLVHIDGETIREDIARVLEVYRWNFGLMNYTRD